MEQSMLFCAKDRNREFSIKRAIANGAEGSLYVELGMAGGDGCRQFGDIFKLHGLTLIGFDSFEGVEEDWTGTQSSREAGAFTQGGALPKVPDNVTLVKGWVHDTLPGYLKANAGKPFSFVHMDVDTYTPTAYAPGAIKTRLRKGTVIPFDELYGYPGWRYHEYKALKERCRMATTATSASRRSRWRSRWCESRNRAWLVFVALGGHYCSNNKSGSSMIRRSGHGRF